MSHLIFTLLFVAAAVFYFGAALICHRRGDALKWPRLATGVGFTLMAIGFLVDLNASHALTFIGAIVVFVSAITTAVLSARRVRRS
ncbi:hypothetical protein [Salinisphaera sp. Q1T1-3]|uniref:hypothetical protein n=1 Tax=Salinisphaera sp. Q1T1-3 TaxID=2321229 RepID=UPI0011C3D70B|nr:hypothetical protein [Salinisphaera sp. Q1T1-3]